MKTIKFSFCVFAMFLIICVFPSCVKKFREALANVSPRDTYLIISVWGLKSATSIDSLSSGVKHNYKGTISDSLKFLWVLNPNLDINELNYTIAGINTQVKVGYSVCSGISWADTTTMAYDTIICAMPWKRDYSDTLFISKVSPTTLVFNVRYADSSGFGMETDTLYKLRTL